MSDVWRSLEEIKEVYDPYYVSVLVALCKNQCLCVKKQDTPPPIYAPYA